jgi:regulator of replication initiation timing
MRAKMLTQKFALAAITSVLIVSLASNVYFCLQQGVFATDSSLQEQVADLQSQLANLSNQTSSLQNENANLTSRIADLEGQAASLSNQTSSFQSDNSNLQDEKTNLQSQLSLLSQAKVPAKLVTRLGASDMRYNYSGQDLRLYITGEVWNVGTEAVQNCSLHVTLYQGYTVAKDTYIELGTINGGSYTEVARNIYYTGDKLTKWTITPEFG